MSLIFFLINFWTKETVGDVLSTTVTIADDVDLTFSAGWTSITNNAAFSSAGVTLGGTGKVRFLKYDFDGTEKILIVDECRSSGNIAEGLLMSVHGFTEACISILTAEDSFIATGPAHAATLPSKSAIIRSVMELLER